MSEDAGALAEALLREAGWVRRLAARLAHEDAADDVVQDAWEAALRQKPSRDRPLGAWLGEVVRRLSHTRTRARARRRDREAEAEAPEAQPAPDVLLEKAELLRLLAQLVGELDEPARTTVLLRYYEGLSAAEIAARQGVPAGTVRWRLKQALDELRTRLDGRVEGGRRAWAIALAGLPAWGAKAARTGGSAMVPAVKVGLGAALAATLVVGGIGIGAVVIRHHATAKRAPQRAVASGARGVAVPVGQPGPSPATVPAPEVAPSAEPPESGDAREADQLLERAKDAYVRGHYARAITLARRAAPRAPKAWRVIGASYCFLNDGVNAAEAYAHVDEPGRQFLRYVCERNNTPLTGVTDGHTPAPRPPLGRPGA